MKNAVDELGDRNTFRGYGPEQGYAFLRDAIVANAYAPLGSNISADEIFISDSKSSAPAIPSPSPTPCILFMWTPTS
jgi:LL-diaminopimelate aminotransferase